MIRPLIIGSANIAVALVAMHVQTGVSRAENKADVASTPDITQEFKDKILLLEVSQSRSPLESKSGTVLLEKVRVTKVGSRDFMIGIGYAPEEDEDYWYKGMIVGVPCEHILRFHAMTLEQFKTFMKKWKERSQED